MASIPKAIESFKDAKAIQSNEHVELELRFAVASIGEFKNLMRGLTGESLGISMEVDLIKEVNGVNWRATMPFKDDGNSVIKDGSFTYGSKEKIGLFYVADNFITYKIAISKEKNIDKFDISSITRIRIKCRNSIILEKFQVWRFDFTATINIQNINDVQSRRQKLFIPGITPQNFINKVPFIEADKFEFEIEYIGNDVPTVSEVNDLIGHLRTCCGSNVGIDVNIQKYIFEIASVIYPPKISYKYQRQLGLKAIGKSPISLDSKTYFDYILPNIQNYAISEKADGFRCIGIIKNGTVTVVGAKLTQFTLEKSHESQTIFEAELVGETLYVFDVIQYQNENTHQKLFRDRIKFIEKVATLLESHGVAKKHIILTTDYASQISKVYNAEYPYEIDGLIFTNISKSYTDNKIYKWKEILTFDFLVKKALPEQIGIPPHISKQGCELYFLFCGISKRDHDSKYRIRRIDGYGKLFYGRQFSNYFPIQFSPSSNTLAYIYYHPSSEDLDDKVCEFSLVSQDWKFLKIRDDKNADAKRGNNFGNDIKTIMSMYSTDILTFEMLKKSSFQTIAKPSYFSKTDSRYVSANIFSKYVKLNVLKSISHSGDAIDLSAGRGADLRSFGEIGIEKLIAVDKDEDALKNLIRKHANTSRKFSNHKMNVITHRLDLNDNWESNLKVIGSTSKLVVCNMAIHYFCESDKSIANFVMLVDSLVASGGIFSFTCMNGKRIFNKLFGKSKHEMTENGVVKYAIKKLYDNDTFEKYGQFIDILLGFSDGKMMTEPLANIEHIICLFEDIGYNLVEHESFESVIEKYSIDHLEDYDGMSDADIEHVSQYDYVVLKKSIITKKI